MSRLSKILRIMVGDFVGFWVKTVSLVLNTVYNVIMVPTASIKIAKLERLLKFEREVSADRDRWHDLAITNDGLNKMLESQVKNLTEELEQERVLANVACGQRDRLAYELEQAKESLDLWLNPPKVKTKTKKKTKKKV